MGEVVSGVLVGHEGHLFLAGGAHDVIACATGARPVDLVSVRNFEANIARRAACCARHQAAYLHVVFPDKHTVLPDLVPMATDPLGPRFMSHLAPETLDRLLDPRDALVSLPTRAFMRVDTHLTDRATARVAALVTERLDGTCRHDVEALLTAAITRECTSLGDLGSKLESSVGERLNVFAADESISSFTNNMQGGNNGIVDLHIHENAPSDSRLLIFGDSFSRRLAYALALVYREVLFCRSPFFHEEVFSQMRPDLVVTANVERYLTSILPDEAAPNFLLYPLLSTATCRPDAGFAAALCAVLSYSRPPYDDWMRAHRAGRPTLRAGTLVTAAP